MIKLCLYSKPDCELCEPFHNTVLKVVNGKIWQNLIMLDFVNIDNNAEAFALYHEKIPVLTINGRLAFKYFLEEKDLEYALTRITKI